MKTVQQLPLPDETILISIMRGDQIIVPRGDTGFRPDDRIIALTATKHAETLKAIFYA
jgi:trk system potassium uptake protein TrkA